MSALEVRNISKRYGENRVLENLSLTFPEGSVTCVMGPSGCGKTTLLHIIAGLILPDSGSVTGRPERISFVFQEDRLCEDFSAVANIRLVTGREMPEEEILRHLSVLGLSESARMPVRELSGGMKRRVAIARAVCHHPGLLLLDEAFKGLDEDRKRMTMDYIRKERGGMTVIFVTHDPAEAEYMGGRLIQLKGKENED